MGQKKTTEHNPPAHKYFTPIKVPKVHHISPPSTFSKLKQEINEMSPIDTTLWNVMENYSPRSRNWLESCVPLYNLDEMMGLNPFKNSLKYYDPTTTPSPLISKEKTSEETKEAWAAVGSV